MHKDIEQARFNMIEQQIRTWEVLDSQVLDLLSKVPREAFVPAQYHGLAFADLEIPIGHGQYMLSPKMEARILQSLNLTKSDKVLEIGTGSGYLTALLATLAKEVVSVDIHADLSHAAQTRLDESMIKNVSLHIGDGSNGWVLHAPYDVIVFTGSLALPPMAAQAQLNVGGRLFAVIGQEPVMEATLVTRVSTEDYRQETLFETVLPPLANAAQPERFHF
jgi:protein-L-isoaspartate(D-aspartate) O-methyltransferase